MNDDTKIDIARQKVEQVYSEFAVTRALDEQTDPVREQRILTAALDALTAIARLKEAIDSPPKADLKRRLEVE